MRLNAVLGLLLAASFFPVSGRAQTFPRSGFTQKADMLVSAYARENTFSGVVLVAKDGKPIYRKAFGLANREWGIPVDTETVFRIGSTTKQFTAAAIMQLADAGKLNIDDPVNKYYSASPPSWSKVTIKQLLTHTSGIPSFSGVDGFIEGPARLEHTPDELIALIRDAPMDFTPGSKFKYDNTGYLLLGIIIEKVSGEKYADYISKHIFGPLGMKDTAYDNMLEVVPKRASGYWLEDKAVKNARFWTTSASYSASGVRSTVSDLLIWDQALYKAKPASQKSIASMFTDYGHGYGFGSFIDLRHGHRLWDHGGNLPGFSSAFERYPDDGVTVIILSNLEGQQPEKIAKEVAGIYFGWDIENPKASGH